MIRKYFLSIAAVFMLAVSGYGFAQTPVRPPVEEDAQSLLSAFVSYTDLRMSSVQQSIAILASTAEAQSGKWKKMKPLLSAYEQSDGGLVVWFVRPDGTYDTVDRGLMNVRLSDRAYFPGLMAGEKVMGALVVSKSTGKRSAIIAVPIKRGGKVIGAIGASLFLEKLADQVDSTLALRPEVAFFALAPNGLTTLHKITKREFLDPRDLGSETLKKAANEMLSHSAGETSYQFDNATKTAVYRTSPLTQWKFAITFSRAQPK